jgi:RNA ligase
MIAIHKYPRTPHLLDSARQPRDEELTRAGFDNIAGRHLVVDEKVDGANAAISFDEDGHLLLQSRGHYLTGGPRERQFDRFKSWAHGLAGLLRATLGARYVVYGEWLYAKHTIYYDALPHHFLEFDVLDREANEFLSTPRRRTVLADLPIWSVPVLHTGPVASAAALTALVGRSAFKSPAWRAALAEAAATPPHDAGLVLQQTDDGRVAGRFKYIRRDFLTTVQDSETHWQSRPILPNRLAETAGAPGEHRAAV